MLISEFILWFRGKVWQPRSQVYLSACVKVQSLSFDDTIAESFFYPTLNQMGGFSATTLQAYTPHCLHIKVCKNISVFQVKNCFLLFFYVQPIN